MAGLEISVKQAVNKAFLKIAPDRPAMEAFKKSLLDLLAKTNDHESEEFHKNLISTFLKRISLDESFFINTKGYNDLVIHKGADATTPVAVILEVKKPTNKSEMVKANDLNVKSLHELLLYYLRERLTQKNFHIRNLIITNVNEWFIFDGRFFEAEFAQNQRLAATFKDFQAGALSSTSTEFFYKEIARPAIAGLSAPLPFVRFALSDFTESAKVVGEDPEADAHLLPLMKTLSAEHLLQLPFANDSNTLDKGFYKELLHIMGLVDERQGTKRLINRKPTKTRENSTLIESTIRQLDDQDKLRGLPDLSRFGATNEERRFNVALELVITWVNRILFLKLLESQLLSYRGGNPPTVFMTVDKIPTFHEMATLFFQVLAKRPSERSADVNRIFGPISYLNSSLFEQTELERLTFSISALPSNKPLSVLSDTILKLPSGKRRTGKLHSLAYLLEFLGAYDFNSDGTQRIQAESRALINASVLGLIFEKINGYKDGSFFTPGFVTMHMCRSAVRMAVVEKFNSVTGSAFQEISDIYDSIVSTAEGRKEANAIVNSIRICDPAVGSGHFLVSALNELILIKAELNILCDRKGLLLKEYEFTVTNDELIITDQDGDLFVYSPALSKSQRVQEALFHEKQTLIEKCLFGVDINPNSVKICRLRLWIELLKHAYYDSNGELETLPNIDINIREGNSLLSRFEVGSDLKKQLKTAGIGIRAYREAVAGYQNADSKEEKLAMERVIADIKTGFRTEVLSNDPKVQSQRSLTERLRTLLGQQRLFVETAKERSARLAIIASLKKDLRAVTQKLDEIKTSKIFDDAFEWRFEFPEVLSDDGQFIGFDALIGNPPYGVSVKDPLRSHLVEALGKVPDFEIYYWFISLSHRILRKNGVMSLIIPNSFLFNVYARDYRVSLFQLWGILEILDCTAITVFADATVRNAILTLQKNGAGETLRYRRTLGATNFDELVKRPVVEVNKDVVFANNNNWGLIFKVDRELLELVQGLRRGRFVRDCYEVSQGYIPYRYSDLAEKFGAAEAKAIVDNRKWHSDRPLNSSYKQLLNGESLTPYGHTPSGEYVKYGPHVASYVEPKFFNGKRLLVREITSPNIVACVVSPEFVHDPQIIAIIETDDGPSVDLLWAILSSKLATFYHCNSAPKATKGVFPKILVGDLRDFPMPPAGQVVLEQMILQSVTEVMSKTTQRNPQKVAELKALLDSLVFRLYGIAPPQVAMIEAALSGSVTHDEELELAAVA